MQFKWLQIFCLCAAIQFQFIVGQHNGPRQSAAPLSRSQANHESETEPESNTEDLSYETSTHSNRTSKAYEGSQTPRYICTGFTENYDCQFRNVYLRKGQSSVQFGEQNNYQKSLTFIDSSLEYLPKSLVDAFPSMILLNLNDLKIVSIQPNAFEHAAYLQKVYLEGNRLIKIDRDAFRGANKLKILVLSKNEIDSIDYPTFDLNTALQYLYLDQNQLNTLPSFTYTTILQSLNASHNNLALIDDGHFRQLGSLQTLDLSFNRLRRLNLQQLNAHLELVDVSFNDLTDFVMPAYVTMLNARNNSLREFAVGQQCRLKKVDLSRNELKTQPEFENCRLLEVLDLSYNSLEHFIYKTSMDKLQIIDLAHNNLFEIQLPIKITPFPISLKALDLSHNRLSNISSLSAFKNLDILLLNNNNLITFKHAFTNSIKHYTMANNEWSCDEIKLFAPKTVDKHNNPCAQQQQNSNGICCRIYSKPYNDRLNEILREADIHERENQKNCPKQESATSNQMTYLDGIRSAMATANAENADKLREIENVKIKQNNQQGKLDKLKAMQNRLANSKRNVAGEIEKQRQSHQVTKEGLISEKDMLERIIRFVQERDAFYKDLLLRRQKDTEESNHLHDEKQHDVGELKQTIETLKNTLTSLKKEEREKKNEKDKLERKVNKNSASIHGSSGTIS